LKFYFYVIKNQQLFFQFNLIYNFKLKKVFSFITRVCWIGRDVNQSCKLNFQAKFKYYFANLKLLYAKLWIKCLSAMFT